MKKTIILLAIILILLVSVIQAAPTTDVILRVFNDDGKINSIDNPLILQPGSEATLIYRFRSDEFALEDIKCGLIGEGLRTRLNEIYDEITFSKEDSSINIKVKFDVKGEDIINDKLINCSLTTHRVLPQIYLTPKHSFEKYIYITSEIITDNTISTNKLSYPVIPPYNTRIFPDFDSRYDDLNIRTPIFYRLNFIYNNIRIKFKRDLFQKAIMFKSLEDEKIIEINEKYKEKDWEGVSIANFHREHYIEELYRINIRRELPDSILKKQNWSDTVDKITCAMIILSDHENKDQQWIDRGC